MAGDALIRELTRPVGPRGGGPHRGRRRPGGDAVAARVDALFRGASLAEAGVAARRRRAGPTKPLRAIRGGPGGGLRPLHTPRSGPPPPPTAGRGEPSGGAADRLREHAVRTGPPRAGRRRRAGPAAGRVGTSGDGLPDSRRRHDPRRHVAVGLAPPAQPRSSSWKSPSTRCGPSTCSPGVPEVPVAARMVAYQLHERADGSRLPAAAGRGADPPAGADRGWWADAYCGMTCRPAPTGRPSPRTPR